MTGNAPAARARAHADPGRRYLGALGSSYLLFAANLATYALVVPFVLRALGVATFGAWLVLLQALQVMQLATTWISAPTSRVVSAAWVRHDPGRVAIVWRTAARYYAVVGALAGAAMALGAPWLVRAVAHRTPDAVAMSWTVSVLLGVQVAAAMQLGLMQWVLIGAQRMHTGNLLVACHAPIANATGLVLVWRGAGLEGLALGTLVATLLVGAAAWRALRRVVPMPRGTGADAALLASLLREGRGYLGYAAGYVFGQSDILVVGLVAGAAPAAVYGIAFKIADYVIQIVARVSDSLFPQVSALDAAGDRAGVRRGHRLALLGALGASGVAAAGVGALGAAFTRLWLGRDGAPTLVFALLGVTVFTGGLVHAGVATAVSLGRMGEIARATLAEGAVKVIGIAALVLAVGLPGAPLGTLLAHASVTLWAVPRASCRLVDDRVGPYVWQGVRPVLVAMPGAAAVLAVSFAAGLPESWPGLAASAILLAVVYAVVYVTIGLSPADRAWARARFLRSGGASS